MTLKITEEPDDYLTVSGPAVAACFSHDEQRELLEALARVHGVTLVDREQRHSIIELATRFDELEQRYQPAVEARDAWAKLSQAIDRALPFDGEV